MTEDAPVVDEDEAVEAEAVEAELDAEVNPAGEFSLVLIDEEKATVDGRYFVPNKVTWREPPIPLLYTTTNGNGHKGGEVGGAITKIWREDGKIMGLGHFESGEKGQELRRLITEGVLTGVSADVGGAMVELEAATETTKERQKITEGKILGVTALPLPAYDDTRIAVTAAAIPAAPPKEWFENPGLRKVTPISVTADGRVYGHVAAWGTCHIGYNRPGECLTPPHSSSNYSHFTIGEVLTAEGETVATGPITLGTGHAGLRLNANAARDHYDNTGTAVADVTAGEDEFGIWVSGAMRPSVTDEKIREFRASAPSGDWRAIGGTLEMVGVLAVNVPGFPIPRAKVEFADEAPLSLVAAGAIPIEEFDHEDDEDCGCEEEEDTSDERDFDKELAALEEQIEELAAKMLEDGEFGRNYTIPNKKSTPKEIVGDHGHEPHGTSILWPAMYEELRKKGMTKEKAARISNAAWNKKHKAPGNKGPGRFAALVSEFHATHNQKDHGSGIGNGGRRPTSADRKARKEATEVIEESETPKRKLTPAQQATIDRLKKGGKSSPFLMSGHSEFHATHNQKSHGQRGGKNRVSGKPSFEAAKAKAAARSGAVTKNTTAPKSASEALREVLNAPRKGSSQQSAHGRPGKGIGGSPTTSGQSRTRDHSARVKKPGKKKATQELIESYKKIGNNGERPETNAEAYVRKAHERREAQSAREGNQARAAQRARAEAAKAKAASKSGKPTQNTTGKVAPRKPTSNPSDSSTNLDGLFRKVFLTKDVQAIQEAQKIVHAAKNTGYDSASAIKDLKRLLRKNQ